MNQDPDHHHLRRIVLPSGRTIEVVRFDEQGESTRTNLHVCPGCTSELVQPVAWDEGAAENGELTLRCPNCNWIGRGVYGQEEIEQLEGRLDEGVEAILNDLRRLTHANMTDEIVRFAGALHDNLILPEDF